MCCGNSILLKGLPFFYLHKIFYTLGTLDKVRDREKDDSSFTNIDDIDWEAL